MFIYIIPFLLASAVTTGMLNQGLYKAWLENMVPCGSELKPVADLSSLKLSHYNRSSLIIKGTGKLMVTITEPSMLRIVLFKKGSHGTWFKTFFDTKNVSICDFIKNDQYIYPSLVDISNLPPTCPVLEGEYVFREASVNLKNLPPMVPNGCYKLMANMWTDSLSTCINIYARITSPNDKSTSRCNV